MLQNNGDVMVIIVGGGPAGLNTGYMLAKKGIRAKVLEEHKKVGEPVQCTGIVTRDIRGLLKPDDDAIVNKLRSAEIHSPGGVSVRFGLNDLVVDRKRLDMQIKEMAESFGCEIKTGIHVQSARMIKDRWMINTNRSRLLCDRVVGADGPSSIIRRILNPKIKTRYIVGKQATCTGEFEKDTFHVYLGSKTPGFFGWVVPESEKNARIGIGVQGNPNIAFNNFIKDIKKRYDLRIKDETGGLIPIYDPAARTEYKKMYIVGDAAGHVKASTGGGVIQGLIASRILAESIAEHKDYEKGWRKILHLELMFHRKIRSVLDRFKDDEYDKLVEDLSDKKIRKVISGTTRDRAVMLGLKLILRKPGLLKYGKKLFG